MEKIKCLKFPKIEQYRNKYISVKAKNMFFAELQNV